MVEPPVNHPRRPVLISRHLSHLALWPACYALGVYLMAVVALGLPAPGWATTLYLLSVAHACYLLDRVKLSDQRQDPADAIALPDRALLFARHARAIRIMLMLEFWLASLVGWFISPALAMLPLGALLGVQLYAGRGASPGHPRFKDLPVLKSFFISSGHIALVIGVLWSSEHHLIEHPRAEMILSLTAIWLIVSGDAILCDLDDRHSDAMYGTRSLPVLLGNSRAWVLAQSMIVLGGLMLILEGKPDGVLLFCASAIWLSVLRTRIMKNRRDLVDARLLPIVLIALLMR